MGEAARGRDTDPVQPDGDALGGGPQFGAAVDVYARVG